MGKATKRKQEELAARQPDYSNLFLNAKGKEAKRKAEITSFDPMVIIRGYEGNAIRPLDSFQPRTRSLNTSTRGKELIRYAFNKYNPPGFLYSVWDSDVQDKYKYLFGLREDFRQWYLALVQGKSLYKECTMGLLTKRETFFFSTCPYTLTIPEVVWYSVIRCLDETAPAALARKIASTKLSTHTIDDFWKGVAKWFILNETSVRQINDLLDYINNRHRENPEWYIKDQTLHGLQKAMQTWHRELYRVQTMARHFEKWDGIGISDSSFETGQGKKKIIWKFHQIKTGKELAEEGNSQHHCVAAYGAQCHSGQISIWSLTQQEQGIVSRALTIEVRGGDIIQARGYANRAPKAAEMIVLKAWAAKTNFRVRV